MSQQLAWRTITVTREDEAAVADGSTDYVEVHLEFTAGFMHHHLQDPTMNYNIVIRSNAKFVDLFSELQRYNCD